MIKRIKLRLGGENIKSLFTGIYPVIIVLIILDKSVAGCFLVVLKELLLDPVLEMGTVFLFFFVKSEGKSNLLISLFRFYLIISAYKTCFCLSLDIKEVAFAKKMLIDSFNWCLDVIGISIISISIG